MAQGTTLADLSALKFKLGDADNKPIRQLLEKQMQILSERSIRENGEYLAPITEQMIELAKLLDPQLPTATVKEIVNKEINKREWKALEATLPPEFLQALQKQFPFLPRD